MSEQTHPTESISSIKLGNNILSTEDNSKIKRERNPRKRNQIPKQTPQANESEALNAEESVQTVQPRRRNNRTKESNNKRQDKNTQANSENLSKETKEKCCEHVEGLETTNEEDVVLTNEDVESPEWAWYCERFMLTSFPPRGSIKWIDDRCFTMKFTIKYTLDKEVLPQEIITFVEEEYRKNLSSSSGHRKQKNYEKEDESSNVLYLHKPIVVRVSVPNSDAYPPSYSPDAPKPSQSTCPSLEWEDDSIPDKLKEAVSRLFTESAVSQITSLRQGTVRKPPPPSSKRLENKTGAPSRFPSSYAINMVSYCLNQLDLQWPKLLNFALRLQHAHLISNQPKAPAVTSQQTQAATPAAKIATPTITAPHRPAVAPPANVSTSPSLVPSQQPSSSQPLLPQQKVKLDSDPWTTEEQGRLETGLKLYPTVAGGDVQERWRNVASIVKTRTSKQCAMRFQELRNAILAQRQIEMEKKKKEEEKKQREEEKKKKNGEAGDENEVDESANNMLGGGLKMTLDDLEMNMMDLVTLCSANFIVSCSRCRGTGEIRLVLPPLEKMGYSVGGGKQCDKCKTSMKVTCRGVIGHQTSNHIADVELTNCAIADITHLDLNTSCEECSAKHILRQVPPATTRSTNCPQCYKRQSIHFAAVSCGNATTGLTRLENLLKGLETAAVKPRVKAIDVVALKADTALPDNGACEHYRKSYRWLRFPCCGRAFPCDTCHDQKMDHPAEWANKMICGHCSREQPFTQKACIHCGDTLSRANTTFWEGGKGCRNPFAMNKNDPKRGKLIGKIIREERAEKEKKKLEEERKEKKREEKKKEENKK
eukprot:GDKK01064979.1.p1 GENE.GDKK01064979.1~~GDKK01064979.1.p1  ORF type:complete len:822 (+),score=212.25 GDKK01064979.1:61-2526(+)